MSMTPAVYSFVVPGPPVAKARARTVVNRGRVHSFTPARTTAYESTVRLAFTTAYPVYVPLDGSLSVKITAGFQLPKRLVGKIGTNLRHSSRPDADNVAKSITDALNGVVWRDDSQISDLVVYKRYSLTPRVEVEIRQIDPATGPRR